MKIRRQISPGLIIGFVLLAGCHKPNIATNANTMAPPADVTIRPMKARVDRIGPPSLYPNSLFTVGMADTLNVDDLTRRYTDHCPAGKSDCTYSQSHRHVPASVHLTVYDEYSVAYELRNIESGEVDHLYPMCAGGSNDISNLWYQPANNQWNGQNFGYHEKDRLETWVCAQILSGKLDPIVAFDRLTQDWVKYYLEEHLDGSEDGEDHSTD